MMLEDKPPYVTFEVRQVEDRNKTIETGHYCANDVDYVIVTPRGSRDRIERVATEWFAVKQQEVREERFPPQWLTMYKTLFEEWKAGRVLPESGTPILTWPPLSPGQQKTLLEANIRTVEDLATAPEEALAFIGMGGRALKQKAINWLEAASGPGQLAERITDIESKMTALTERNVSLEERNKALEAENETLKTANEKPARRSQAAE